MIIKANSREENLIKKSIRKMNILSECKNINEKRKNYKSLFRIFLNNPDIFRYLKESVFTSYKSSFNDFDDSSLYPSMVRTCIMLVLNYDSDIDIDIKGVDEMEVKNFLGFISIMNLEYGIIPYHKDEARNILERRKKYGKGFKM